MARTAMAIAITRSPNLRRRLKERARERRTGARLKAAAPIWAFGSRLLALRRAPAFAAAHHHSGRRVGINPAHRARRQAVGRTTRGR